MLEEKDTSDWNIGKVAVADSDKLNGYDDGLAFTYDMVAENNKATINVGGISGKCVDINLQPVNGSWEWSNGLTSVTITGIALKAKAGATYN